MIRYLWVPTIGSRQAKLFHVSRRHVTERALEPEKQRFALRGRTLQTANFAQIRKHIFARTGMTRVIADECDVHFPINYGTPRGGAIVKRRADGAAVEVSGSAVRFKNWP